MTNDAYDRTALEQHVAALSQHSEQVAAELAEAKTKALQHQEESSTLRSEMEAAGQEEQDLETQRTEALEQRQSSTAASSWTTRETDEDSNGYIVPPVAIPTRYRTRDVQGGNDVGGNYVIFTYWAFKRRQQRMRHLRPIPERTAAGDQELPDGMKEATPVKMMEVVNNSLEVPAQTRQRRSRKRSSEEISDTNDRLQQLRRKLNSCLASGRELTSSME